MDKLIKLLFTFLFDLKRKRILNKKISHIYRSLPSVIKLSDDNQQSHKNIWSKIGSRPNLKWYKVYASINQIDDPNYITEVDYYIKAEPTLNNRVFAEAYSDKNSYYQYLDARHLPQAFIRNIEGAFYDRDYHVIDPDGLLAGFIPQGMDKVIVKKAVDSGGGREVELFTKTGSDWKNARGETLSKKYLERKYGKNFLIQEYVRQHSYYSQFNATSVNTVRLFTYRSVKTNQIIPLQAVLRIGQAGANVDNLAAGGVACGIGNDGTLNPFGVNKKGGKIFALNGITFSQIGPVFKFSEIVELAMNWAVKYRYHRLLGFDICVDERGEILVIEINNRNLEINFLQMNNGPLFGDYTKEVVDFCSEHKRTIGVDYEAP